jgi:hypothetical protein
MAKCRVEDPGTVAPTLAAPELPDQSLGRDCAIVRLFFLGLRQQRSPPRAVSDPLTELCFELGPVRFG